MGAFWPGNDASGPNISIRAMTEALGGEYRFLRLSLDRPFGARVAMERNDGWLETDTGVVHYCAPGLFSAAGLMRLLRETRYDILLLNGFFDARFTIPALVLRRLGLVPARSTIVAPRGEFAAGALSLKSRRKNAWRALARRAGLLRDVWLHATSEAERRDIMHAFPGGRGVIVAPNIRLPAPPVMRLPVQGDVLQIVFLGRIAPVKNLDFALQALALLRSKVAFDIYGPIEDRSYWGLCEKRIAVLPANVVARHRGTLANERVPEMFAHADLLFLPSKSENFGHAIFEALSCGVPVLVGDATPWRNLEADAAGWDLPLDSPEAFAAAIDRFVEMGAGERAAFRAGAMARAALWLGESDAVAATRRMFETAIAGSGRCAA